MAWEMGEVGCAIWETTTTEVIMMAGNLSPSSFL